MIRLARNTKNLLVLNILLLKQSLLFLENKNQSLYKYKWLRIILDEAHNIKNRSTKRCKGICTLKSYYKWCLTGTPIQNKLDDLFGLMMFLKLEVFGEYSWWNSYINNFHNEKETFGLLNQILKTVLLRRTKKSTYKDGSIILSLPKKYVEVSKKQN